MEPGNRGIRNVEPGNWERGTGELGTWNRRIGNVEPVNWERGTGEVGTWNRGTETGIREKCTVVTRLRIQNGGKRTIETKKETSIGTMGSKCKECYGCQREFLPVIFISFL